jgi:transcriptional regulator with XRE-family HTH domain
MEKPLIDVLNDRIRHLMHEHNVRAAPLARRAQLNESAVRDILRGRSRNPGIVTLQKIASVLNLRPSALFEAPKGWPLAGIVEGDGQIRAPENAEIPPNGVGNPFFFERSDDIVALYNNSAALDPMAFSGDYLIYQVKQEGFDEKDLGRPCVCVLKDGRKLIRVPRMSDEADKLHLSPLSLYGSPELNVEVVSASRVAMTLPPDFIPVLPEPTHQSSAMLHEESKDYKPSKKKKKKKK